MSEILRLSREILARYPLCDRCLGRLFANLGRGLSNLERGRAIKLTLAMGYHDEASRDPERLRDELYNISRNAGEPFQSLYRHIYGAEPPSTMPCYICGGRIESLISEWVKRAGDSIRNLGASRFILGIRPPRGFVEAEEEIARVFSLQYWESIRSELKREIGKSVATTYGLSPDFDDPEVMLILDLERGSVEAVMPPLILSTRLVKLVRGFSVKRRPRGGGSLEDIARSDIKDLGRDVSIKIPIRDTSRYRILGRGCESIIEIRSPEPGRRDLRNLAKVLNRSSSTYRVEILGRGSRRIAEELPAKVRRIWYRAHIYIEKEVDSRFIESLAPRRITGVEQKTPSRILRAGYRGVEKVVRGDMGIEKILRISNKTLEILFTLPPNIYAEEAITGDGGRTSPSISSLLGVDVIPLEIDVINIEI
ncbi:tRNA pseudouridine(54/55) synthase Pus10 [Desulfurococcaceae archaeon AG1]|jgi:tRNA pseudouridine synthase 10|nr:tRNA pseudouridine(54/55) synthase Pus10 [Desulfurococcaceae archaeon AG1]